GLSLQPDGTSVQRWLDEHRRDARLLITIDDGPIGGRCASVSRQEREVNVDAPSSRRAQKLVRQNAAVGDDDCNVRIMRRKQLLRLFVLDARWLKDCEPVRPRKLFDWRES